LFEDLERIASPTFRPTDEDISSVRLEKNQQDGTTKVLIDQTFYELHTTVRAQHSERRRKWLGLLNDTADAVIFMAAFISKRSLHRS
jgi:hypothetical protein